MNIILILLKIILVIIVFKLLINIYNAKRLDNTLTLKLDLLSSLALCVSLALLISSILSVYSEDTFIFTIGLIILTSILIVFQYYRLIFVGEKNVFIKGKLTKIKDIKSVNSEKLFFLRVNMINNKYLIYVPLTNNNSMHYLYKKTNKDHIK